MCRHGPACAGIVLGKDVPSWFARVEGGAQRCCSKSMEAGGLAGGPCAHFAGRAQVPQPMGVGAPPSTDASAQIVMVALKPAAQALAVRRPSTWAE